VELGAFPTAVSDYHARPGGYRGPVPVVAAAVCPHPPMLVPEVASGAAPELDDLRTVCGVAVSHLLAADPDVVLAIGSSTPSGASVGRPDRPLSLAVADWLLARSGVASAVGFRDLAADLAVADCVRIGQEFAAAPDRMALLVMGDGSACRGPKSPGYDDPRAETFDAGIAAALTDADTTALLALDPVVATELHCAGRAPWQVLAAATNTEWHGGLHYNAAPYGVAYFVATWYPPSPADPSPSKR
jgi:hypothetical protein